MIYNLFEVKRELEKRLLDIDTMISWNDFLDLVEEKPRKVIVIYGYKLGEPSERTLQKIDRLGVTIRRIEQPDLADYEYHHYDSP